jgi:hypothetical protein
VNADTLVLLERPFAEVVDDLLTAIVGGVVNEPLLFDIKSARYPLAEPALGIRSVTGVLQGTGGAIPPITLTQFQLEVDYTFSAADNALIWREEGRHPEDNTVFYVDYIRRFSESPLTDFNVGSVTRTVTEAIAREIAFVYQQIKAVYLSGFIDTATGPSLDFVVSILGIVRKRKDFAEGLVTFFRDPSSPDGNVSILEGTLVMTAKGEATFVTSQLRTLQRGQGRIDVPTSLPGPSPIASRCTHCSRSALTSSQFSSQGRRPFGSRVSRSTFTEPSRGIGAWSGMPRKKRIMRAAGSLAITRFHRRSTTTAG